MSALRIVLCNLLLLVFVNQATAAEKMIIATRGTGSPLAAHSLPAATLAAAMRAQYLVLPVVMTADDQLVVFEDLTLDRQTDVARVFPGRHRDDGAHYLIDFTLAELRSLRTLDPHDGGSGSSFRLSFALASLQEELALLGRLESLLGHQTGLIVEIRQPWFHLQAGKDVSAATVSSIASYRQTAPNSRLFLQSFDPDELQRIHSSLLPEYRLDIPLIQLVGVNDGEETRQSSFGVLEPYNYDWLYTNTGLRMVSTYAHAIALPSRILVDDRGHVRLTDYVSEAQRLGLKVLTFPLSNTAPLPPFVTDFTALIDYYFSRTGIDGVYTDSFLEAQQAARQQTEVVTQAEQPPPSLPEAAHSPGELQADPDELPPFFKNLNLSRPGSAGAGSAGNPEKMLPE